MTLSRAPLYHYFSLYLNQGVFLACNRWHESLHMIANYPFMCSNKKYYKKKTCLSLGIDMKSSFVNTYEIWSQQTLNIQ